MPHLLGWCRRVFKIIRQPLIWVKRRSNSHKESRIATENKQMSIWSYHLTDAGSPVRSTRCAPKSRESARSTRFSLPKRREICSKFPRTVLILSEIFPNFASIARPLANLTKSSTPFVWKEDQEASMLKLKNTLIEKTFLADSDQSLPMEIHPVASSYGSGAVLIQRIEGLETPLVYASRLLKGSQVNYIITEKECLVAVWALKKFQYLVWGCQIIIVTDHHALCWLLSKKELAGRLGYSSARRESKDYSQIWKGTLGCWCAISLPRRWNRKRSRRKNNNFLPMCNITAISESNPGNLTEDLPDLLKSQLEDAVSGQLYKSIENAECDNKKKNNYVILNGILYRKKIKKCKCITTSLLATMPHTASSNELSRRHHNWTPGTK